MLKEAFEDLIHRTVAAARAVYGERLVSLVLYGSVARGTMRHDSDMDVLVIARDLPRGRLNRMREFAVVEDAVADELHRLATRGIHTSLSPLLKTPDEVAQRSPLFLDMVEDARVLYDREGFFAAHLARMRNRLAELGARRIWRGNAWYWDLKPDYRPGEVFEL